jgi:hypothetical protein
MKRHICQLCRQLQVQNCLWLSAAVETARPQCMVIFLFFSPVSFTCCFICCMYSFHALNIFYSGVKRKHDETGEVRCVERKTRSPPGPFQVFCSDSMLFPFFSKFLTSEDQKSLWCCNQWCRLAVMPCLAPRLVWDAINLQQMFTGWTKHQDLVPYVTRVLCLDVDILNTAQEALVLTEVTFGDGFNQRIEQGVLPASLTRLTFGRAFNQPIKQGVLPAKLTHLAFGDRFNQPIGEGVLPANLTQLAFLECGMVTKLTFGEYCQRQKQRQIQRHRERMYWQRRKFRLRPRQ